MFVRIILISGLFIYFGGMAIAKDFCGPASNATGKVIPDIWQFPAFSSYITGMTAYNYNPESFINIYIGDACRRHDVCYTRKNANKKNCDKEFLRAMRAACGAKLRGISISKIKCRRRAKIYYTAVRTLGKRWFVRAQARAQR